MLYTFNAMEIRGNFDVVYLVGVAHYIIVNRQTPGRPTNLGLSRARAYCACSGCGWGLFGFFSLVYHFSFLLPLSGRQPDID